MTTNPRHPLLNLLFVLLPIVNASAEITVVGSSTVGNHAMPALAKAYKGLHPGAAINVQVTGSGGGIESLLNGKCSIAMSSRGIKPAEISAARKNKMDVKDTIIGYDSIVVYVNESNTVPALNFSQLRRIFSGECKDWQEVGGNPGAITVLIPPSTSGTLKDFEELALTGSSFSPTARAEPTKQAITTVARDPLAVTFASMEYLNVSGVRQMPLEVAPGKTLIPSVESTKNLSWPLVRPLRLYTNGAPSGEVKSFVDFILSAAGQAILQENNLVPLQ